MMRFGFKFSGADYVISTANCCCIQPQQLNKLVAITSQIFTFALISIIIKCFTILEHVEHQLVRTDRKQKSGMSIEKGYHSKA